MSKILDVFTRKHDYLICVDSDGCAMDTMDIKHKKCFGPCMIKEWNLEKWAEPIQTRWDEINLYSMTRGINRFKGLAMALREINEQYIAIDGIEELCDWADHAKELSNPALEQAVNSGGHPVLKKALEWSYEVNRAIVALSWDDKKVFPYVKEGFEAVRDFADIVIVSSANRDAVEEEWEKFGLLDSVDLVLCQDEGSKAHCIAELKKKGYAADHILMSGDAPGDRDAAKQNGVFYYPILVRHEEESWKEFPHAAQLLHDGNYTEYGREKEKEFLDNLSS